MYFTAHGKNITMKFTAAQLKSFQANMISQEGDETLPFAPSPPLPPSLGFIDGYC